MKKTYKEQDIMTTTEEKQAADDAVMTVQVEDGRSYAKAYLPPLHVPSDAIALLTPDELQAQIGVETQKRKLITEYITKHMSEGVDYGKIHMAKNCSNRYQCQNAYHFSKDVLFKPGAEKFCSLFRLRAEFARDDDTWEMMGKPVGLVCYVCRLYTAHGGLAGEGRGAASIDEKGNPNVAIKTSSGSSASAPSVKPNTKRPSRPRPGSS
jgi:hypothetical protein